MAPACVGGRRFGLERFEGEFRCRGFVLESSTQKSKLHEKGRQRSGEQSAASTRSGASSIIMSRGASPMVLPLQQLPEALQQHLAEQLPDATTAGRLAQVSQGFKLLLQPRLAALNEAARRLADKQAAQALERKRQMVISCFGPLEEGAIVYRCIVHRTARGTTPCHGSLKVSRGNCIDMAMLRHIKHAHPMLYGLINALID